jgi:hypothetical protein
MKKKADPHAPWTIEDEMFDALFRIFRTWQQRQAVGHDLAMRVRSIVRRVNPHAYANVMKRWPDTRPSWTPLPPQADEQSVGTVNSESPDSEGKKRGAE